jgi:hypothetical protein
VANVADVLEDLAMDSDLAIDDFSCDDDTIVAFTEAEAASWMLIEEEDNFREDFLRLVLRSSEAALDKYLSCEDARACFWW